MLRTGESLNLLVGLWWEWSSANYMLNVDSVKYITDCFFFFVFFEWISWSSICTEVLVLKLASSIPQQDRLNK